MSETGIIIIIVTAFYAIAFAYRRFMEEYHVTDWQTEQKILYKYTSEHNYDTRAINIQLKYSPIFSQYEHSHKEHYSPEWRKAKTDMLCEMLSPYKNIMTREELIAYKEKDYSELDMMARKCLFTQRYNDLYDKNLYKIYPL